MAANSFDKRRANLTIELALADIARIARNAGKTASLQASVQAIRHKLERIDEALTSIRGEFPAVPEKGPPDAA